MVLSIAKHLVDLIGCSIQFRSDPTLKPGISCIVKMALQPCESPEAEIKEDSNIIIEEVITWPDDDDKDQGIDIIVDNGGGKGQGIDIILGNGGDMPLLIHEGKKSEYLFLKNRTLPDPTSTDNA